MEYKGHLYIKCAGCGREKRFFTRDKIEHSYCNACGSITPFTEPLKPLWVNCECGAHVKYYTNVNEKVFDTVCCKCDAPVAVEWIANKRVYSTIRE